MQGRDTRSTVQPTEVFWQWPISRGRSEKYEAKMTDARRVIQCHIEIWKTQAVCHWRKSSGQTLPEFIKQSMNEILPEVIKQHQSIFCLWQTTSKLLALQWQRQNGYNKNKITRCVEGVLHQLKQAPGSGERQNNKKKMTTKENKKGNTAARRQISPSALISRLCLRFTLSCSALARRVGASRQ